MSSGPDQAPGGRFDPWSELRFAIGELHSMAVALGVVLRADDEEIALSASNEESWRSLDLLERIYHDIGELSGTWLRLRIADRTGRDPLLAPGLTGQPRLACNQHMLRVVPVTFAVARAYVAGHHRHHPVPPVAYRLTCGAATPDGILRGVAIAGFPVARALHDGFTLEVTRNATDGTPNAASMLYSAIARAARALGYTRVITYTQDGESGVSLRAAGWLAVTARRPRSTAPGQDYHGALDGIPRTLWQAPGSPLTRNAAVTPGRLCKSCWRRFAPSRSDARWCSPACRQRAYRARARTA